MDHPQKPEQQNMRSVRKICLCAVGLTASISIDANELGRLFFTPEQRSQLDSNQVQKTRAENNNGALVLNGIVQIHGGKRTAWINGVPQAAGGSDEITPENMTVTVPGQIIPVQIKVGQRVLLHSSASQATSKPDKTKPDAPGK